MPETRTIFSESLHDRDGILVATVSRRHYDDLDYVGLSRHDDVITVSADQLPELIALLKRALDTAPIQIPADPVMTMISDENGIGRGYRIEATRDDRGNPRPVIRFVLYELDEADELGRRRRVIEDIVELDLKYVEKQLRPRAGLRLSWLKTRWGIDRIAAEPILAAIAEHRRRITEEEEAV